MREKPIIIICITILLCLSIICGAIFLTNNQNQDNNTTNNSSTNNTTTINLTNNTSDSNTSNTTTTTKKSTTTQSTKRQSTQQPQQRDDYIGEGGRNDYDYVSEEYESNGHRYRDIHWYDGSVDKVQQD